MTEKIIRVATDVGGTFTDLVCFETDPKTGQSTLHTAKTDTTPPDYEVGVLDVLEKSDVDPTEINFLAHGTTVVINALAERKRGNGWTDHHGWLPRCAGNRAGKPPGFLQSPLPEAATGSCRVTCERKSPAV